MVENEPEVGDQFDKKYSEIYNLPADRKKVNLSTSTELDQWKMERATPSCMLNYMCYSARQLQTGFPSPSSFHALSEHAFSLPSLCSIIITIIFMKHGSLLINLA